MYKNTYSSITAHNKQIKIDKPLRRSPLNKGVEAVGKSMDNFELNKYRTESALEFLFNV